MPFSMRAADASIKALCVISLLSAVNLAGLYVFSTGFLTARVELPHRSSHDDIASFFNQTNTTAAFDRAVLLIVDALRVDFIFPDQHGRETPPAMHQGQMPKTSALLSQAVRLLLHVAMPSMTRRASPGHNGHPPGSGFVLSGMLSSPS